MVVLFDRVDLIYVDVGKLEAFGYGHLRPHVGLGGIDRGNFALMSSVRGPFIGVLGNTIVLMARVRSSAHSSVGASGCSSCRPLIEVSRSGMLRSSEELPSSGTSVAKTTLVTMPVRSSTSSKTKLVCGGGRSVGACLMLFVQERVLG